jgi:diaminopimelate epimerase
LFIRHYGLSTKNELTVRTKTTQMDLKINEDGTVTVDMGKPQLHPQSIPLLAEKQQVLYPLAIESGEIFLVHAISVGNPHAVLLVDDLQKTKIDVLGKAISLHPQFPEQSNAGFMHIMNKGHIQVRVFERGCGETQACGSGAVAAAAIGRLYHQLDAQIKVSLLGGDLQIDWPDLAGSIYLTGSAHFVYEGALIV